MAGIIFEGGTFRPIYSCGVMDALLDNDIMFPYCIGVSAGITNAVSYISRQRGRGLDIAMKYRNDKRYIGAGNIRKDRSLFGLNFIFDELPNGLMPFDYDTYYSHEGQVKIGVTNCLTGKAEYLDGLKMGKTFNELRATCSIPLMFPPVYIEGTPYYDGGIADPIPIRKSIADGNEKNFIILTQTEDYVKTMDRQTKFAMKRVGKKYPNLYNTFLERCEKYNETRRFCKKLQDEGRAVVIYPEYRLKSMEKDIDVLKQNYDMGYRIAEKRIDEIKDLLK